MCRSFCLKSGERVVVRDSRHIHGVNDKLLQEALHKVDSLGKPHIEETLTFDEVVGVTNLVEITPADEIVYARRVGRYRYSKFVLNRPSEP